MQPKNTNSILIESNGLAAIFDPWGNANDWLELLQRRNLKLYAVYITHGHFDHIMAVPGLTCARAGWFLHSYDLPVVENHNQILAQLNMPQIDLEKNPPHTITIGTMEILPGINADVLHLPGHSAGGVGFYFSNEKTLIVGDTLFQDGYGRTDLITADDNAMRQSLTVLRARNFPDDTIVIHGHGMETTVGWLKENNPFFK